MWTPIMEFENLYEVSNLGRIKTIKTGKINKDYLHIEYKNSEVLTPTSITSFAKNISLFNLSLTAENIILISTIIPESFISLRQDAK